MSVATDLLKTLASSTASGIVVERMTFSVSQAAMQNTSQTENLFVSYSMIWSSLFQVNPGICTTENEKL